MPQLVQPICPRYINVADRRRDGRTTDDYDSNTALALCASRGNYLYVFPKSGFGPGSSEISGHKSGPIHILKTEIQYTSTYDTQCAKTHQWAQLVTVNQMQYL